MHHSFHFSASRFNATERKDHFMTDRSFGDDLVAWLRDAMLKTLDQADIGELIQEDYGWGFWVEFGGDRCRVYAGLLEGQWSRNIDAEWLAALELHESLFFLQPGAHARRQDWFDGLVATVRSILTADPAVRLLGESDD
jgi:hypothetical protein